MALPTSYEAVQPAAGRPGSSRVARVIVGCAAILALTAVVALVGQTTEDAHSSPIGLLARGQSLNALAVDFLRNADSMSVQDIQTQLSAQHLDAQIEISLHLGLPYGLEDMYEAFNVTTGVTQLDSLFAALLAIDETKFDSMQVVQGGVGGAGRGGWCREEWLYLPYPFSRARARTPNFPHARPHTRVLIGALTCPCPPMPPRATYPCAPTWVCAPT